MIKLASSRATRIMSVALCLALSQIWAVSSAQDKLTVSVVANPIVDLVLQPNVREFEQRAGVEVTFDALPFANLYQKQVLEVTGRTGLYDVLLINLQWAVQYIEAGMLQPLNAHFDEDYENQFFPSLWTEGLGPDGQQYIIPQRVNVFGMVYNKERLDEIGIEPPATWDELRAAADALTSEDRYGMAIGLRRAGAGPSTWLMMMMSTGESIIDENGEPQINSSAGVGALELLVDLAEFSPPGVENWHWPQARSALEEGLGAIHLGGLSVLASLDTETFAAAPTPVPTDRAGQPPVTLLNAYAWAVPVGSKNPEAAWEFIEWVTSPEMEKRHALSGVSQPVESAQYAYYEDPEILEQSYLARVISTMLGDAQSEPRLSVWPQIAEEIGVAVSEAILGQVSPQAALDAANARARELLIEAGLL